MSETKDKPPEGFLAEIFEVITPHIKSFLISVLVGIFSFLFFGFNIKFIVAIILTICVFYWLVSIGLIKNTKSFSIWIGFTIGFLAVKFVVTVFFWLFVLALVTIFVWPMIFKKNNL